MALYQSLTSSSTPEQIAAAYKEAIASAGGDTAANQKIATDYLTSLGISAPTITAAYNQYLSPTGSMGALPQTSASADPIEQLYQQYAGRAADPGGLDYWRNQFGSEVDPNETSIFQRAVAEGVAKGIESTATATNYNPYFTANPDVAAAYLQNTYGLTPEQFAAYHYNTYGQYEGRAAPTAGDTGATTASSTTPSNTLRYYTGKTYPTDQVVNLAKQLATIADLQSFSGGVFGENKPSVGFDYSEAVKALGGSPTTVDQVLLDSAANLLDQGITDISQLKPSSYTDPDTGETTTQNRLFAGQTYSGPGVTNYQINFDPSGKPKFTTSGADTGDKGLLVPLAIGASLFGVPALLGSALAPGAAAATQAAVGGAAFGGGISALTGQNIVKGALLGGVTGYAGSALGDMLKAGVTDTNLLKAAADADVAGGMLPQFGTNAAYDAAMQNLITNSPGAVQQLKTISDASSGAAADTSAGLDPTYGSNATYDQFMQDAMTPDAQAAIQNQIDTAASNAANVEPGFDNWTPNGDVVSNAANVEPGFDNWTPNGDVVSSVSPTTFTDVPQADYSNEGKNYPTEASTQGKGGSPINASMAAATGIPAGLGSLAKLAAVGLGAKGVSSLMNPTTGVGGGGFGGDGFNPLGGYRFDPSKFQATIPDPAQFRPTEGVVTVPDAIRMAAARQGMPVPGMPIQAMAEGGPTKPTYTPRAKLAMMSPWERAAAQLNNYAYAARMPVAAATPQANVSQLGQFAAGGGISDLGSYSDGGRMLKGAGDGMSDSIPATIGGHRPARLADGEFVIPADVVSGLGNGSTDAGAKQLYKMMDRVRKARTGTKKQGREINPGKMMPV